MARLRFDRHELAGAFGDLGTLLPFLLVYAALLGMNPAGLLFTFGAAAVAAGWIYATPIGVQPMKVIGVAVAAGSLHGVVVTAEMVYLAGFLTGVFWLLMAGSGLVDRLSALAPGAVVMGLVLGLGLAFVRQGVEMMAQHWGLAIAGLALVLLVRARSRVPSMFLLLLLGAATIALQDVGLDLAISPQWPRSQWSVLVSAPDAIWQGALMLVVAQLPLTFGNAVLAAQEQNNRLFPQYPTGTRKLAATTGLMNLFSAGFGGMPLCHGAGGMAAHTRFGARSGTAPIVIGGACLVAGLLLADPAMRLVEQFPTALLGVMLLLAGASLATGACRFDGMPRAELVVVMVTAGAALWNVSIAFLLGLVLYYAWRWNQSPD